MTLKLQIVTNHPNCIFLLSDGHHTCPAAILPYPTSVMRHFQAWQEAYLDFYENFARVHFTPPTEVHPLRGRVEEKGSLSATENRRSKLKVAEEELRRTLNEWLRDPQLHDVREAIAHATTDAEHYVDLLLTCDSMPLQRLPWEWWEYTRGKLRIARTPEKISQPAGQVPPGRTRILVILGDDTGLDFGADQQAVRSLSRLADIEFIGWQLENKTQMKSVHLKSRHRFDFLRSGAEKLRHLLRILFQPKHRESDKKQTNLSQLPSRIAQAIADERGWHILLFLGHSNEMKATGGELAIAPGMSISIKDIAPQLTRAKEKGLQFALFNSCKGLDIAGSLIDLGFSQVAVMREPIHNLVAQEFLAKFFQNLSAHKDVHESLLATCEYLKLYGDFDYPSTYLVPSLFRHPEAKLFRVKPYGFWEWLKQWLPTKRQAIALLVLVALSLSFPLQGFLLEQRVWAQAIYRRATGQVSTTSAISPPVLLVQIDNQSIAKASAAKQDKPFRVKPIDRRYLASLVNKLAQFNARVIGIDYLLDRKQEDDLTLVKAIEAAIARRPHPIWFVFANEFEDGEWTKLLTDSNAPQPRLPNWSLQGDIYILVHELGTRTVPTYLKLLPSRQTDPQPLASKKPLPFSYLLVAAQHLSKEPSDLGVPQPNLSHQVPFQTQLANYLKHRQEHSAKLDFPRSRQQPITVLSYWIHQMWMHPIIDFSIPPDQGYRSIPAWKLLQADMNDEQFKQILHQIVIIAPGDYAEAGLTPAQSDSSDLPAAIRHWRFWREHRTESLTSITGGEVHAYVTHQYLTQRFVIPIPDLWMVGVAAILGQGTMLMFHPKRRSRWLKLFIGATVMYGLMSLQLYISAAVLLPWLFPVITFWIYVLPLFRRKGHA